MVDAHEVAATGRIAEHAPRPEGARSDLRATLEPADHGVPSDQVGDPLDEHALLEPRRLQARGAQRSLDVALLVVRPPEGMVERRPDGIVRPVEVVVQLQAGPERGAGVVGGRLDEDVVEEVEPPQASVRGAVEGDAARQAEPAASGQLLGAPAHRLDRVLERALHGGREVRVRRHLLPQARLVGVAVRGEEVAELTHPLLAPARGRGVGQRREHVEAGAAVANAERDVLVRDAVRGQAHELARLVARAAEPAELRGGPVVQPERVVDRHPLDHLDPIGAAAGDDPGAVLAAVVEDDDRGVAEPTDPEGARGMRQVVADGSHLGLLGPEALRRKEHLGRVDAVERLALARRQLEPVEERLDVGAEGDTRQVAEIDAGEAQAPLHRVERGLPRRRLPPAEALLLDHGAEPAVFQQRGGAVVGTGIHTEDPARGSCRRVQGRL